MWVVLLAVGTMIGLFVDEALGRGVRWVDRRRASRHPLIVHVETDPSIIWAEAPPWVGASFLVPPDADLSSPPAYCPQWRAWATSVGGVDEGLTQVRVTLVARRDLVVVVDALRVRVHRRQPAPAWRQIMCAVGGADITPRRVEVRLSDFDPPSPTWISADGEIVRAPTFTLSGDEAEMLHIWAYVAEDEQVEWTAELLTLVDGQRVIVEVSDGGRPFVTAGSAAACSTHVRASGGADWTPAL
jgi:hypothetical protein